MAKPKKAYMVRNKKKAPMSIKKRKIDAQVAMGMPVHVNVPQKRPPRRFQPTLAKKELSIEQVTPLQQPIVAIKIREIRAEVRDITTEVIPDKVIIQGILHKQIFFVGTDDLVHHQPEDIPFSTFIDLPGAEPGMKVQVNVVVEHITFSLINGGTVVHQKVILEIFVKVLDEEQILIEPGDLQILGRPVVGEGTVQELIQSTFTLPVAAIKISEIRATIEDLEPTVIEDKVLIQGTLHKQIFFVDTNNLERHVAEDVEFSTFIDIPGAEEGMHVQVTPTIESVDFDLVDSTTLEQTVVVEFFVKVTDLEIIGVTAGEGEPLFQVNRFVVEEGIQFILEEEVILPLPAEKIDEIVATFENLETEVIEDKVIVQGTVHQQIFFISEGVAHHLAVDLDFSRFIDAPGAEPGMDVFLTPEVEDIIFELITPTLLRKRVIVSINAIVTEALQINLETGEGPLLKLDEVIGENTRQILIERDVPLVPPGPVLPEVVPALIKIEEAEEFSEQEVIRNEVTLPTAALKLREVTGTVEVTDVTVLDSIVIIEGNVIKEIVFVDTNNVVQEFTEIVPFTIEVELPEPVGDQQIEVNVEIEKIIANLIDCITVEQTIVLEATVSIVSERQVEVITDVIGEGIVLERILVETLLVINENTIEVEIPSVVELDPPAASIEEITLNILDATPVVVEDGVEITGTIQKLVTYLDDEGETQTEEELVPFEFEVPVPGATPDMGAQIDLEIVDLEISLSPDGTLLTQNITLEAFAKVHLLVELFIVTEVSGPGIEEVITEVLTLQVVGEPAPRPVEVVVAVITSP